MLLKFDINKNVRIKLSYIIIDMCDVKMHYIKIEPFEK